MNTPNTFWDRHADGYAKRPVANEASYPHKLAKSREYFRSDMDALELGCGTGSTALVHAPYVRHILATDISAKMLEIAERKKAEASIQNVTFQQETLKAFKAPEESFDAISALSLLHLLEDKEAVIAKVYRLLKPGGVFITSTVCLGETMKFFKLLGPIGKFFGLLPTIKVFTVPELLQSLTHASFAIDYQWQPEKGKSVFIVAKKTVSDRAGI